MKFDVVIPSKDREEDIYRMINSIFSSTIYPENIIVVDQSIKKYDLLPFFQKGINIIHKYDPSISGASVARNVGVRYSNADYVYIFDDDIILDNDFFEIINKHFMEYPHVVGICGRQKNSKSTRFKVCAFSLFHHGEFKDERKKYNSGLVKKGIYPSHILSGGIVAYKRTVFEEFEFDDIYIKGSLGEDRDFSYRVGKKYPLMFATDALALHNHSQVGRYDAGEDYACRLASGALFYKKNLNKTAYNFFCYMLVNIGIWLDAIAYSIKNHNTNSMKGITKGYHYIHQHFEGVPFVDAQKYRERYLRNTIDD